MLFSSGIPSLPEGARRSEAIIRYKAQQTHGHDHGEEVSAGIFVTAVALRLFYSRRQQQQNDTQLVSTLYRTHKSLAPSFKVSSLYVFDALARAAKHQVNKQKLPLNDDLQATGNAATFLSKLAGVVEGLFQDMQNPDIPEGKVSLAIAFLGFPVSP